MLTCEVHGSLLHCTDVCNSASAHTQIRIHTDFLLRVSVYVSVLGLQGLWYVSGPRPETHKDRPATGCEEGVVLEISHSPTDPGTQDRTHNQSLLSAGENLGKTET